MINPELVQLIESWIYSPMTIDEIKFENMFRTNHDKESDFLVGMAIGFFAGYNEATEKKEGKK